MKKFMLFVSFLLLIMFSFSFKPIFYDIFSLHNVVFSSPTYSIYCLKVYDKISFNVIDNGNSYILKCDNKSLMTAKSNCSEILGESVSFVSSKSKIDEIIDFYEIFVKKSEKFDDFLCLYGYSKKINSEREILLDNEKINVQIAFKNNILTIGTPIILGDY